MPAISAILGILGTLGPIAGPVVRDMLQDFYQDWREGRRVRQGMAMNAYGNQQALSNVSGVLQAPDPSFLDIPHAEPPILIAGGFVSEEFFADFVELMLDEEEQMVTLLIVDQETQDVYFCEFDFDGYGISLWPGVYSFYAFVIDPVLDEVLGIGYPFLGDFDDPNPISIEGEGIIDMDFFLVDADEL